MKKITTIAIFALICINTKVMPVPVKHIEITPVYDEWNDLIKAMAKVESENNPDTINRSEKARGCLQIRPIMVREANRILGRELFDTLDCFNISKSLMIFQVIQSHWNPTRDIEIAAKLWNGGPRWRSKVGVIGYWERVRKHLTN